MKVTKVYSSGKNIVNVKLDTTKLELLSLALGKKYVTQVGVLGDKSQRKQGQQTNASIGAVHEFGSFERGIPERSFLRMPLTLHLGGKVKESAEKVNKRVVQADLKGAYEVLGAAATATVDEAFQTGGFNNWAPLKPETIARKGSDSILIDTSQLRKSITFRVVEK